MIKTYGATGFAGVQRRLNGIAAAFSLGKPAAAFPGRVATDADLMIAVDRQQTRLGAALDSSATSMTVEDAAAIGADNLLTIDSEIVRTTGAPVGNVVPIARGFDGTTPATHLSSAVVSGFIDAYHHNALVAEVEAIEQALGPNLANVPSVSLVVSSAYDFAPQTPGGSLTVGNNVINLAPVPLGVNGSDLNHYLYISGGTGTAEAGLITGGTGVAGAASGTVIVNCANTHSGAWTIRSATAGIQEAVIAVGTRGSVQLRAGISTIHAPIRVNDTGIEIRGHGSDGSLIDVPDATTANVFEFVAPASNQGNALRDVFILGNAGKASGWAIYAVNQGYFNVSNVFVQEIPSGAYLDTVIVGRVQDMVIRNLKPATGVGLLIKGNDTNDLVVDHFFTDQVTAPLYGVKVEGCGYAELRTVSAIRSGTGLAIVPGSGQIVSSLKVVGSHFDNAQTRGVLIAPAAGGFVQRVKFDMSWSSSAIQQGFWITTAGGGTVDGVQILNHEAYLNGSQGILISGGANINIESARVGGNSVSASGTSAGIHIAGGTSNWSVINTRSGPADGSDILDIQAYGLYVAAGASDNYRVIGNDFSGNLSGQLFDGGTGLNRVVTDNLGVDSATPPTVASAASIALPSTDAPAFFLSGTTAVTTITGGWKGRTIRILKSDAGPVTVGGGGNVPGAHTLAQNQSITLTFDGTSWY